MIRDRLLRSHKHESSARLEKYAHLFHFLYCHPQYLGRLFAAVSASKDGPAGEFLGRAVLSLFSCGNGRVDAAAVAVLMEEALEM